MDEEPRRGPDYGIHEEALIQIISQFLASLNVPLTNASLRHEISLRTPNSSLLQEQDSKQSFQEPAQGKMDEQVKEEETPRHAERLEQEPIKLPAETVKAQNPCITTSQMALLLSQAPNLSSLLEQLEVLTKNTHNKLKTERDKEGSGDCIVKEESVIPRLAHIFSAYDSMQAIQKIHIPINHTLTIETKSSKRPKFVGISPHDFHLVLVDMESNLTIYNTKTKAVMFQKKESSENHITCLKWLSEDLLVLGKANGSIELAVICLDLKLLATIRPAHTAAVLDVFQTKDFLYSLGADYCLCKISKKRWKVAAQFHISSLMVSPKNSAFTKPTCKIAKISHQRFRNISFIMDSPQGSVCLFDEVSQLEKEIFNLSMHCSSGVITDMIAHQRTNSLLLAVSEKAQPEIYQIFPLTNQVILRVSGAEIVSEESLPRQREKGEKRFASRTISFTCYHDEAVLAFTSSLSSGTVYHVSMRNWRILHAEAKGSSKVEYEGLVSVGRLAQLQDKKVQRGEHKKSKQKKGHHQLNQEQKLSSPIKLNHEMMACLNKETGNLQIYDTDKSQHVRIRSEQERLRSLPRGAEGFLTLIQNIRQNYSVFF